MAEGQIPGEGSVRHERPFPLTPALSLGERENRIPSPDKSERFGYVRARTMGLPLLGVWVGVWGNGS
jgi:hypothetical protein